MAGSLACFRPQHTLIFFRNRRLAFVNKLLHALAAVGLGGKEVALRIGSDAVHRVELAWLSPAIAEAGQNFERIAKEDVDFLIRAISQENVDLVRILGKGDINDWAITESSCGNESFFDESTVLLEYLDAVVGAVADVEQALIRKLGAVDWIAELLGGRRIGVVRPEIGVVRLFAVSAPVALVLSGLRIVDDYAVIAIAVGDIQFIGSLVDKQFLSAL